MSELEQAQRHIEAALVLLRKAWRDTDDKLLWTLCAEAEQVRGGIAVSLARFALGALKKITGRNP